MINSLGQITARHAVPYVVGTVALGGAIGAGIGLNDRDRDAGEISRAEAGDMGIVGTIGTVVGGIAGLITEYTRENFAPPEGMSTDDLVRPTRSAVLGAALLGGFMMAGWGGAALAS